MQDLKQTRTLFDDFFSINKILLLVINVVETSSTPTFIVVNFDKGRGARLHTLRTFLLFNLLPLDFIS